MSLKLTYRNAFDGLLEADPISPDRLQGLGRAEIERLTLRSGRRELPLAEAFQVEGDGADGRVVLEGHMERVSGIGQAMARGCLIVEGNLGPHAGRGMSGGTLEIRGHCGDRAGAGMSGGLLRILGNAGDHLGAASPGARLGMRGGTILVRGAAGDWAGTTMRRGLIAVGGPCGAHAGHNMIAGTILVLGRAGQYAGAGMRRGTLALLGAQPAPDLPGFRYACRGAFPFLELYLKAVRSNQFAVPEPPFAGLLDRYNGDLCRQGQGEILQIPA